MRPMSMIVLLSSLIYGERGRLEESSNDSGADAEERELLGRGAVGGSGLRGVLGAGGGG